MNKRLLLILFFFISISYNINSQAFSLLPPECGAPEKLKSIKNGVKALSDLIDSAEDTCSEAEDLPGAILCGGEIAGLATDIGVVIGKVEEQIKSCSPLVELIEEILLVVAAGGVEKVTSCIVDNIVKGLAGSLLQHMDLHEIAIIVDRVIDVLQAGIRDLQSVALILNDALNDLKKKILSFVYGK